jgi:hypothetical protein
MGWGERLWEGTWGALDTPVHAWGLLGRLDCIELGKLNVKEGNFGGESWTGKVNDEGGRLWR